MELCIEYESVWDQLARKTQPIALYGMGDGADKILREFEKRNIRIAAVFASDAFVRGHRFHGFQVERLRDVTARLGMEITIVVAFASQRSEVLKQIDALDAKFDVVAPDVPVMGNELFTPEFVRAQEAKLCKAYEMMADEQSRCVFADIIAFKLTGKLQYLRHCESEKREAFERILRPSTNEHFVDLGAYNGDTIRELLSYTEGQYASITAMEPDRKNFKKLKKYVEEALLNRAVNLFQAGAWDKDGEQYFSARAGRNSMLAAQGVPTQVRSVDSILSGDACTLLKLDVEGAEHNALRGAEQTIIRHRPRLNVAAYHRSGDLWDLPLLLHELLPSYRLYLRHHPYIPAWDVNLYARAD